MLAKNLTAQVALAKNRNFIDIAIWNKNSKKHHKLLVLKQKTLDQAFKTAIYSKRL